MAETKQAPSVPNPENTQNRQKRNYRPRRKPTQPAKSAAQPEGQTVATQTAQPTGQTKPQQNRRPQQKQNRNPQQRQQASGQPQPKQNGTSGQPQPKQNGALGQPQQKQNGASGRPQQKQNGASGQPQQKQNGSLGQQAAPRQNKPRQGKGARRGEKKPELRIIPLGGLNEIGKNTTVFECGDDMFLLDCGAMFPDGELFGVDLVIPDFTYLLANKDKLRGIFITHGHEDHIGSLPYLLRQLNVPIYSTPLGLGLIGNKLAEHGLKASAKMNTLVPKQAVTVGCMKVTPIRVNHSIPDAVALAIETPAGTVIHTGDFKIDFTPVTDEIIDLTTFGEFGRKGVLAMLSDSTNAERPGFSRSERSVGESFANLFVKAGGKRIIIATFASNLQRIQQIIDMAVKYKRKVAISGRSMVNNTAMAFELGYLHAPDGIIVDIDQVGRIRPEDLVIVTTGSQGETLSALSRMAGGSHRNVRVDSNDFIIISASPIPGNEKMVTKVINGLMRLGAEVIYESMYDIHTSGHAYQEEQKLLLSLVKPKFFIPAHGEYKHLRKHANTAMGVGIPEKNIVIADIGDVITLTEDSINVTDTVPAGRVLVDGLGVGDVGSVVLRDRRHLSEDGLIIASLAVDGLTGSLISGPEIVSRGFVYMKEAEGLINEAKELVKDVVAKHEGPGRRHSAEELRGAVRDALSTLMYRRTRRSPMILPVILEV